MDDLFGQRCAVRVDLISTVSEYSFDLVEIVLRGGTVCNYELDGR